MAFFYNKPRYSTNVFSVGDAVDQMEAFDAQREAGYGATDQSSVSNCENMDPNYKANWRKAVYNDVINLGGRPTAIDFFTRAMGVNGEATKDIDASELFIKYRNAKDYNIVSNNDATAAGPGQPITFTMLRAMHSVNGKFSNVSVGGTIYIYEDQREVTVTNVNKSVDFAHVVTVVPKANEYTARIRKGVKMFWNPVRSVNGESCHIPTSTWETPGYITSIKPLRIRKDWQTPLELLRKYEEVLQFALMFDHEGRPVDSYETFNKTDSRESFMIKKQMQFLLGEKITNPLLLTGGVNPNEKYSGFMGYLPSMYYGGGHIYDVEASEGFDLDTDFTSLMTYQDSQKLSKEFMLIHGRQFWFSMERRSREMIANATGACTFEAFRRGAAGENRDEAEIARLGISSYRFHNMSVHFHEEDAFTDTRMLGNGIFPHLGIMMPADGLRDASGRSVPPIEFFSMGAYSGYEEVNRDMRKINGCERLEGDIKQTIMMAVHGVEHHILLNPILYS